MRIPDFSGLAGQVQTLLRRGVLLAIATCALFFLSDVSLPQAAAAYPFWAQETAPLTPREATGRIVCANCHSVKHTNNDLLKKFGFWKKEWNR